GPQAYRRRVDGQVRDLLRVHAAQFAVHLQEPGQEVRRGELDLQLGRMLDDLRNDAPEELVVDLDATVPETLFEHVVDEGHLRFVTGIVARERGDWRVQILVVEEAEKRDAGGRVRC